MKDKVISTFFGKYNAVRVDKQGPSEIELIKLYQVDPQNLDLTKKNDGLYYVNTRESWCDFFLRADKIKIANNGIMPEWLIEMRRGIISANNKGQSNE